MAPNQEEILSTAFFLINKLQFSLVSTMPAHSIRYWTFQASTIP
jgi:hypothetical protein